MDHAGSTLYSSAQMNSTFSELTSNCFGNPHSRSPSSRITSDLLDQTRAEVLNFFNANKTSNEYSVIFTSGATSSLKLVAESFVFSNGFSQTSRPSFVYLKVIT